MNRKKFTKDFPVKQNYVEILYKMNPYQNLGYFLCKIFCWRLSINLYGNFSINFKREYFKKDFLVKKKSRGILCKMNPKNHNGKKGKNRKEKTRNRKERKKWKRKK